MVEVVKLWEGGGGYGMKAFSFGPDVGAPRHHPTFCTGLEHQISFRDFRVYVRNTNITLRMLFNGGAACVETFDVYAGWH